MGVNSASSRIIKKTGGKSVLIDDIAEDVAAGISTGGNSVFCITKEFAENQNFENEILKPMLAGKNIDCYKTIWNGEVMIYSTKHTNTPAYPNIYNYLLPFEEKLAKKREAKKGLIPWWSLHWPRNPELFMGTKIIMRQTSDCIRATLDEDGYYSLNSLLVLKLKNDVPYSYKFVLAVLNSTLNNYIYRNLTQEKGRTFAEVKPKNVRKLFIPQISEEEQKPYEQLVSDILDGVIEKEVGMAEIDQKLYDFYQLSDEEILEVKGVDK